MKSLAMTAATWVGVALLVCGARVAAHEIGTTRVAATVHDDRRYDIEIVTDAAALAEKLDALSGQRVETHRVAAFDDLFRKRVTVAFDGAADHPAIRYAVRPQSDASLPPVATIRLSGEIPAGARRFSWTYGWTFASYALSITTPGTTAPLTEWLEGGQTSTPFSLTAIPPPPRRAATVWRYLVLGFTHIVPHGVDHVLFVLGIVLLTRRMRAVLWQVSAFTAAHSITLALSIYGVIGVSSAIVEPLIALSIAYVAIENLVLTELRAWRVALVFAFGLLHGMGFAGVLQEIGLPRSEYVTALLTFNVGVEAGQLAVIATASALVGWHRWSDATFRRCVVVPASVLIACTAVYWTIERAATPVSALVLSTNDTAGADAGALALEHARAGDLLFDRGHVDAAAVEYHLADQASPNHLRARTGLARVAAARGHYTRALELYRSVMEDAPTPEVAAAIDDILALTRRSPAGPVRAVGTGTQTRASALSPEARAGR
ncbi:MAG: HupE/UreJ family protein [Acidobacteria bacterium]|nr:HupE/UreJ family protein [Acidobacteriota bacterium]